MKTISKDLNNLSILVLLLILVSPLLPYSEAQAASSIGATYFGGKVTSTVACTCNTDGSSQVTVQGPGKSAGTYLYIPANKTYSKHSVKSGKYLLGKYKSGGECLIIAYPKCTTEPISKGTIDFTGTS